MLNRRLLRIKAFKVLFSSVNSGSKSVDAAQKELLLSCEKTKDLYYFLMNISGALVKVAKDKIDAGLRKFRPSEKESNPNLKFVNNRFAELVGNDPEFGKYCQKRGLIWAEYDSFVKKVYNSMVESEYYAEYMASSESSLEEDCKLFENIFAEELEDNEALYDILEDISLFWMDDVEFVLNVIITGLQFTSKKSAVYHPATFVKEDDKDFAVKLLSHSMINYEEYLDLVTENVENWGYERLISTDRVLIVMGVVEAVYFPSIPIKVTINEYVDIAKFYSTPNSRIFVNGLLDRIIQQKIEQGEIVKSGRGLL